MLVHGSWHGGWCWRKLTPLLRRAGHEVYTPTLTGVGERSHLLHPGIDLSTHIKDVVQVLELEDLREVILVGHSYGGMVITGVASGAAERISRLVYLDAFVPRSGQTVLDNLSAKVRESWTKASAERGEGWRLPPLLDAKGLGVTDPEEAAWVDRRLLPHPMGTYREPLAFDEAEVAKLDREYVRCTRFPGFGARAKELAAQGWEVREVDAGHDVMIAAPEALARLLLSRR